MEFKRIHSFAFPHIGGFIDVWEVEMELGMKFMNPLLSDLYADSKYYIYHQLHLERQIYIEKQQNTKRVKHVISLEAFVFKAIMVQT